MMNGIHIDDVAAYFDEKAKDWDSRLFRNEEVISLILDNAGIEKGKEILDVGCGTGVLIGDYLKRNVKSVTAVDISERMLEMAAAKYPQKEVAFLLADAAETDYGRTFDRIVIYNALPHFSDPDLLLKHLSAFLNDGGILSAAHGMSRNRINQIHHGTSTQISQSLMDVNELAELFSHYLEVQTVISDERMYQVTGCKRKTAI